MNGEYISLDTAKKLANKERVINILLSRISKLEYEVEELNNIIKEAREYAGELRLYDNESIEFEISTKLLEILDKENKNEKIRNYRK